MTDRQRKTLELFCEYLNGFNEFPDDTTYTVDNWDPSHNEFGSIETIAQYETGHYSCEVYELNDGDDGGPNVLTMYFDHNIPNADPITPWWGTQEFDTEIYFWLKEGKMRTPDDA
jgi:hypothetical protein